MLLQTFDKNLKQIDEKRAPTQVKKGQKIFLEELENLIAEFFHNGIKGIGVALPGIVDKRRGILIKAPHLPVKNLHIKKCLEARFKKPVIADNDVNAFLYAQIHRPALKPYDNIVAVMIGTGVGGAIVSNGKLVYGKNGFAGEVGHMITNLNGPFKTLEQNVSGHFIPRIARELGIKSKFTAYDLSGSSAKAKKMKKEIIKQLGIGLANLNLILNPNAIVLGGSIYKRHLRDAKRELSAIIEKYSLDGKSPLIFDANPKNSAAEGMARMILKKS